MTVRYRHKQTLNVATYAYAIPRLERSDDWELVVGDEAPNVSALREVWVDFAISQGMDPDEATSMHKKDLLERYGG